MLREKGVEAERINYFDKPFTSAGLKKLIKKTGLTPFQVLRKGEAIFKELNLSEETPADKIIELMIEYPGLLQRPIVEVGDKAILARPMEKALELIK